MRWLRLCVLLAAAFTLAVLLQPPLRQWASRKAPAQGLIAGLLGDSRRLFANHFFIEADVYLHGGYYPSIFDLAGNSPAKTGGSQALHEAGHEAGHEADEACAHDFLGKPRNWLDAFGRHFFPSQHTHAGEGAGGKTEAREILPWIKLAAELDPRKIETYTVGAFWLRLMGRNEEALRFLREGLRANPGSYEILFELGRCYEEKKDTTLARNLWELALHRWQAQKAAGQEPDRLTLAEILTRLARLEVRANRRPQAVAYLEMLKQISPNPVQIQKRIDEVKAGQSFEAEPKR